MTTDLVTENAFKLKNRFLHTRPALPSNGHNSFENASIQALFACELFRVYVLLISESNDKLCSFRYLSEYFKPMAMGCDVVIRIAQTTTIYDREVDPCVYLTDLLDTMSVEYEQTDRMFDSFPCDQFATIGELKCKCQAIKYFKWITSLKPLGITQEFSINELVDQYFSGNTAYGFCQTCKHDIKLEINEIPNIFILHINNEKRNEEMFVKYEQTIEILGEEYELIAWISRELVYYCCNASIGGVWYRFKHQSVKEIYETPINLKQLDTAYLLFYQKETNISETVREAVDALIPVIEYAPKDRYTGSSAAIPYQLAEPPHLHIRPQQHSLDLIDRSLGQMPGLFQRSEGICYFNTSLQALFHCEAFRLHVLSGGHSGRFHQQLRQLFLAMSDNFQQGFPKGCEQEIQLACNQFYQSFCLDEHKEFATYNGSDTFKFITTLLLELNDELKHTSDVRLKQEVMLEEFKQKPCESIVAWRQLMFRQCKSYIMKMFAVQRVMLFVCKSGHRSRDYNFNHWIADYLLLPRNYQRGQAVDIQMIVNNWSVREWMDYCSQCGQHMNWYSKITRANNCLIFDLENLELPDVTDQYETVITINEAITVCSQYYYCKAVVVHIGLTGNSHCFVFVRVNNEWLRFDDENVVPVPHSQNCMLPEHCYTGQNNRYAELVFYEKVSPTNRVLTECEQQLLKTIPFTQQHITIPKHT